MSSNSILFFNRGIVSRIRKILLFFLFKISFCETLSINNDSKNRRFFLFVFGCEKKLVIFLICCFVESFLNKALTEFGLFFKEDRNLNKSI